MLSELDGRGSVRWGEQGDPCQGVFELRWRERPSRCVAGMQELKWSCEAGSGSRRPWRWTRHPEFALHVEIGLRQRTRMCFPVLAAMGVSGMAGWLMV